MIRWGLQHDISLIPKASSKKRIQENLKGFDFYRMAHSSNGLVEEPRNHLL